MLVTVSGELKLLEMYFPFERFHVKCGGGEKKILLLSSEFSEEKTSIHNTTLTEIHFLNTKRILVY